MGLIEKSMLERWEMAKIEARLDKAKSIKQQKVCCLSNTADDEAQTIDAEPVKHGRWLPHKITASSKCSLCRRVFADETPYCPNCGAKMGLKKGESE